MKTLLAAMIILAGCSTPKKPMMVTPAIMVVRDGQIAFINTGAPQPVNDSLNGKKAYIITKQK